MSARTWTPDQWLTIVLCARAARRHRATLRRLRKEGRPYAMAETERMLGRHVNVLRKAAAEAEVM
jgi:hypothetical protein